MRLDISLADALARSHNHAYRGFNDARGGWVIPRPVNPHTHLRDPEKQGDIFELVVPETAKLYSWATAMPNLGLNRIRTPEQAVAYRRRILMTGRPHNPRFDVVVPLFLEPDTDPKVIRQGFMHDSWRAAKIYPRNGTTESDFGVDFRYIEQIFPCLKVMEELGILCLIHAEVVLDEHGDLIVDRLREGLGVSAIDKIFDECPNLRVVVEHISSRAMVAAMKRWQNAGRRIEATIAPQYLLWNSSVLFEKGMNPISFSVPILKDEEDRVAVLEFMISGGGMLGTDSAPHDIAAKSQHKCCPGGVFNEPTGLFVYFHLFRMLGDEDWFEKFVDFACHKANQFYGFYPPRDEIVITEKAWHIPYAYERGKTKIIPMFAGVKDFPYSLKQD